MVNTVSLQYARALFDLAEHNTEKIIEYRQNLKVISDIIDNDAMFQKVLDHPKISKNEKKDIFRETLENKIDPNLLYFLYVLIDNDRIDATSDIIDAYQYLMDQADNKKNVVVYSKVKLSSQEMEQLKVNIDSKFQAQVELTNIIDSSISGGVRLEYEGYILDDTLTSKLDRLKNVLKSK